jgi:PmbA protein
MMKLSEKYLLAEAVINHALKNGAQQISVVIDESQSNDIEIRDEKIDNLTESNQSSLTMNLYVDNKYSARSTNRLIKDDLLRFLEEGIAATRFLAEDKFRSLPDPELYFKGVASDNSLFDNTFLSIDPKTKIDLATQVMNEAYKKDDRIISVSSNYSDNLNNTVIVTSNGFKGDTGRSSVYLSASVSIKSNTGRPSDYWYENSRFFDKLKKTEIGKKALERTIQKINPKKIASGKYGMILENRVAGNLLRPVLSALQGASIDQKQSFLAGKTDKKIAASFMTIFDDPTIPAGPGSRLFDNEGIASLKRPVIEDGILRNFFIDNYYSKKLGMKPTTGYFSNLVFKLGSRNMGEMTGSLKKGILVTGFNGGNCNGTTGDFSYGIEGFLIENGKIVHPVNEMNITGNMNQIWFDLAESGNDIVEGTSFMIPSLRFENVDFSGI